MVVVVVEGGSFFEPAQRTPENQSIYSVKRLVVCSFSFETLSWQWPMKVTFYNQFFNFSCRKILLTMFKREEEEEEEEKKKKEKNTQIVLFL